MRQNCRSASSNTLARGVAVEHDPVMVSDLSDEDLEAIAERAAAALPGPWKAWVEGRDHLGGDTFIMLGEWRSPDRGPDMYISLSTSDGVILPDSATLDFIASARGDVPRLVRE